MDDNQDLITRYAPPSRLDLAPYGTIVKVIGDDDEELYVQLSQEDNVSEWKKVRNLLGFVFKDYIFNQGFMNACLDIYRNKNKPESLKKISSILNDPSI